MSLKIIKSFSLDFTKTAPLEYIFVKTGDRNARILDITPLNSGKPYIIPEGAKALFIAKKPDGTDIIDNAEIDSESGHILVTLSNQTLAAEGITSCEIGLYGAEGEYLSSQHFYMKADEHLLDGVESSNEYEALIVAMLAADQKVRGIEHAATKAALRDAISINGEIRYPSEGLAYELNEDGASYKVVGLGACTDFNVVVPRNYNGKPVTAIGDNAFENAPIDSINLWETVTSIGAEAFKGSVIRFVYIHSTTPITVGEGAFDDTVKGYFVPLHNVEDYKANEGWMLYADKVVAFETPESINTFIVKVFEAAMANDENLSQLIQNLANSDAALQQAIQNLSKVDNNLIAVDTNLQSQINQLKPKYSEGLAYDVVTVDGVLGFEVTGIGTCTDTDIIIPPTYSGYPVLSIGASAFSSSDLNITSIIVPDSVKSVATKAFFRPMVKVTFLAETPPTFGANVFYNHAGTTILVPYASLTAYKSSPLSIFIHATITHIETLETLRADIDAKQTQINEMMAKIVELENLIKGAEE